MLHSAHVRYPVPRQYRHSFFSCQQGPRRSVLDTSQASQSACHVTGSAECSTRHRWRLSHKSNEPTTRPWTPWLNNATGISALCII